jgi:CO/xanthine dehydrogenase Mo-binding subunit
MRANSVSGSSRAPSTLAQVIADELGARMEDIRILQGDSAVVAHGTGTYASRSAVLAGGAATLASRLLKEKVIRAASYLLEASVEDHRSCGRTSFRPSSTAGAWRTSGSTNRRRCKWARNSACLQ